MTEKSVYQALREKVLRTEDRIDRVENVLIAGMPDCNICINGVESWVEIKCPAEPARHSTALFGSAHKLSQDQMNWFKRHYAAEGQGYVLIVTNRRWMLIGASLADKINTMTMDALCDNAQWMASKPVHASMWPELRAVLARRRMP